MEKKRKENNDFGCATKTLDQKSTIFWVSAM
jgi:hypothetical protein